ncbi:pyridoxal-phosphate dependent enzyme [Pseudomonas aeruginosa]|nr:pyridoxal-phosphate dependent enzyme [Pseudomonas aeruginosa]
MHDRYTEDREQIGRDLAQRHGLTLIPPYDHPDVLAGQGTAARSCSKKSVRWTPSSRPSAAALLSGCALAIRALAPACRIYGVEPEAGNDGQRSLRSGAIVHIDTPQTLADGAQTQHLGNLTFPLIQRNVDDILTASDAELVDGMRFLAARMKLLVEPTGCLGLAAARQRKDELRGKRVGILLSGGNVDLARFCALLGG